MELNRIHHYQSDTCTYSRRLSSVLGNAIDSRKKTQQYLKSFTLIKTATIGLLSCVIFSSFAIVQYTLLENLYSSSEEFDGNIGKFPAAAAASNEIVTRVKSKCDCDNVTITCTTTKENYAIKKQLEISESIWRHSVAQRHTWIATKAENNLSKVNPWDGENYVFFWNYFAPSFNCPHSVQRVGFIGDGGKWLCGLELYEQDVGSQQQQQHSNNINNDQFHAEETSSSSPKPSSSCIIYSFGVANESSFEAEMLNRTNCRVFAYDYSVKNIGFPVEPTNPRVTFKALGIGNKNLGKFRTLKYFMDKNGHDWIDILKMDVEGGEYAALDKVMQDFPENNADNDDGEYVDNDNSSNNNESFIQKQQRHHQKPLPFGQLLLEVHVDAKIFPKFYDWWERMEARGLRAYYSEVNHVACAVTMEKPNYVEYSFINTRGTHRLLQK